MKGCIFSIEEFALYDGPGIRTAVFFKGCPLSCSWCHNPEGKGSKPVAIRNLNGCIHCNRCFQVCPHNREYCDACGKCLNVCPKNLIRMSGTYYEAADLAKILLKNVDILNMNGGGITFSGGEPLLQIDFLLELLSLLKGKTHLAIETSGFVDTGKFTKLLSYLDLVMFDMKVMDKEMAKYHEGINNELILNNLKILQDSNTKYIARVPLIPGVIDTKENIESIIKHLSRQGNLVEVDLLPYNKLAGAKYSLIGQTFSPKYDDSKECYIPKAEFESKGFKVKVL